MLSNVWPGDKPVTQPWGCTSLSVEPYWPQAQCHWHTGIDIGMLSGTPLYAARAGRVSEITYGILALQVTGRTETDYYVHIDRAAVAMGQTVTAGALVAYSGNKAPAGGVTFGPHLHFEVNTGALNTPASSIDPVPVLKQTHGGSSDILDVLMALTDAQQLEIYNGIRFIQWALIYKEDGSVGPPNPAITAGDFASLFDNKIRGIVAAELAKLPAAPAATLKLGGSFTGTLSAE